MIVGVGYRFEFWPRIVTTDAGARVARIAMVDPRDGGYVYEGTYDENDALWHEIHCYEDEVCCAIHRGNFLDTFKSFGEYGTDLECNFGLSRDGDRLYCTMELRDDARYTTHKDGFGFVLMRATRDRSMFVRQQLINVRIAQCGRVEI